MNYKILFLISTICMSTPKHLLAGDPFQTLQQLLATTVLLTPVVSKQESMPIKYPPSKQQIPKKIKKIKLKPVVHQPRSRGKRR